jgi:hypothetical protein
LAALKTYFDGSKSDSTFLTLACLATDETLWGEIESQWEDVRKNRGNPRFMHMADAMALEGEFKGWDEDKRNYLVDGFLNVFLAFRENPRIYSFTSSVDLVAHAKWKQARTLPSPARLCARTVFPQMMDWYGKLPDKILDAIECYWDRNEPFMRHIEQDWRSKEIRRWYPVWNLIRIIVPVDMEFSPALQMSDVIAWGRNRLECGSHWQTDPHYATAVRAANTIRWIHRRWDELPLSSFQYREEGYAAIDPQRARQAATMKPTTDEFKNFDRTMRALMSAPHSEIKAKSEAERAAKPQKRKKRSPSKEPK